MRNCAEERKNKQYKDRIALQLNGEFMPCIFTCGGRVGRAANYVISTIANKLANVSMNTLQDIIRKIQMDISVSLIKS